MKEVPNSFLFRSIHAFSSLVSCLIRPCESGIFSASHSSRPLPFSAVSHNDRRSFLHSRLPSRHHGFKVRRSFLFSRLFSGLMFKFKIYLRNSENRIETSKVLKLQVCTEKTHRGDFSKVKDPDIFIAIRKGLSYVVRSPPPADGRFSWSCWEFVCRECFVVANEVGDDTRGEGRVWQDERLLKYSARQKDRRTGKGEDPR